MPEHGSITESGTRSVPTTRSSVPNRLTRVDPRHAGRCGVAFLDGHVKMVLPKETEKPVNMWMAK
ncbi:MAG: H-X9-DG-CTERM domain-containing protein [Armatimonadia bacterium]